MGFGQVISSLPVFKDFLQTLLNLPLNPYLLTGIITNIAAGLLGSASGGMLLTLSTVGENIVQMVDPEKLHRLIIIASTGLDTLPHNSAYLAMLAYTGLKFKETYFDYFMVTVLATLLSFAVALIYALSF
jgi:H+/gluconate symporter-like permease